jgi:hypothetical protein
MKGISLFLENGFKIKKQKKIIDGKTIVNYLIDSPKFGIFEVNSLNELTKEKYDKFRSETDDARG